MREKDITEKALENYDDVFADIVEAGKERSRDMMRSKMLDRAEARGEARGRSDALQIVRLFINENDVSRVAEALGEEESVVRKSLVEAGLIEE